MQNVKEGDHVLAFDSTRYSNDVETPPETCWRPATVTRLYSYRSVAGYWHDDCEVRFHFTGKVRDRVAVADLRPLDDDKRHAGHNIMAGDCNPYV